MEPTALRVITIGGIPRRQGGKYLGYGVPGEFFVRNGRVEPWPWVEPPKPKPKPLPNTYLSSLGFIYCFKCDCNRMVLRAHEQPPANKQVICPGCRTKYEVYR